MTTLLYKFFYEQKTLVAVALVTSLAGLTGFFLVSNPYFGFAIGILPFVLWFGVSDKRNIIFLFLLFLPYHGVPWLSENLMGATGAKPFNLISAFMIVLLFFHGESLFRNRDKTEKKAMFLFFIYILVFAIATFRSLDYLDLLHMISPEAFHNSPVNHMLSFFVRPALFTLTFIYILKHIKTEKEINQCIDIICVSVFLLSCAVLSVAIININKIILDRVYVNEAISAFFNMHYNAVGSIYIICTPLLVLRTLRRSLFSAVNFSLAGVAVLLLQSRTTIVIFLCGSILLLYYLKNRKMIALLIAVSIIFFLFWLPEFLERVFLLGIKSGDLNTVFSGRIDNIWIPVIMERFRNPDLLLFGVGLYSIFTSPHYLQSTSFQVGHAHNAFIEIFIDCGFLVLGGFVFCLVFFLLKAWSFIRKIDKPIGWALFICIINFLISTLTGRNFYPSRNSMFLFPVIALFINYFRIWRAAQISQEQFPHDG